MGASCSRRCEGMFAHEFVQHNSTLHTLNRDQRSSLGLNLAAVRRPQRTLSTLVQAATVLEVRLTLVPQHLARLTLDLQQRFRAALRTLEPPRLRLHLRALQARTRLVLEAHLHSRHRRQHRHRLVRQVEALVQPRLLQRHHQQARTRLVLEAHLHSQHRQQHRHRLVQQVEASGHRLSQPHRQAQGSQAALLRASAAIRSPRLLLRPPLLRNPLLLHPLQQPLPRDLCTGQSLTTVLLTRLVLLGSGCVQSAKEQKR